MARHRRIFPMPVCPELISETPPAETPPGGCSDECRAGVVPAGLAGEDDRSRVLHAFAAESGEESSHHAAVDRADDRVLRGGFTERTLLGYDCSARPSVFCVSRESLGSESVRDGVHGGPERALALARFHALGESPSVLLSHSLGHALRLVRPQQGQRLAEKRHEQIVAGYEKFDGCLGRCAVCRGVALGGATGAGGRGSLKRDLEITTGCEAVEMMPRHVRVKRESGGD